MLSLYYDARPQLRRIEARLRLSLIQAQSSRRKRIYDRRKHPEGPTPDAVEADALRHAVEDAIFALRLLHE